MAPLRFGAEAVVRGYCAAAEEIGDRHGAFAVGLNSQHLDGALARLNQQLLLEASGIKPVMVSPDRARYSREHVGSPFIGWLHFQPIYEQLVATQPDMFT